jgi:hypothetical protein
MGARGFDLKGRLLIADDLFLCGSIENTSDPEDFYLLCAVSALYQNRIVLNNIIELQNINLVIN